MLQENPFLPFVVDASGKPLPSSSGAYLKKLFFYLLWCMPQESLFPPVVCMPKESLFLPIAVHASRKLLSTGCDACLKQVSFYQLWCMPQEILFPPAVMHA
jgi:hypothetical protein